MISWISVNFPECIFDKKFHFNISMKLSKSAPWKFHKFHEMYETFKSEIFIAHL